MICKPLAVLLLIAATFAITPAHAQIELTFTDPLVQGVREGDYNQVRQALLRGQSAHAIDPRGDPLLLTAVDNGFADIAALLMEYGARPDSTDQLGTPALLRAALLGDYATVKVLLDAGAHTERTNGRGTTALMAAAENGYADVVSLLLENGADPEATDYTGRTPLDYAREGRSLSSERQIEAALGN